MEDKFIEKMIDKYLETKKKVKKEEEGLVCPNCGSIDIVGKEGSYTCNECDFSGGIDQFQTNRTEKS